MQARDAPFAICLQETWMSTGTYELANNLLLTTSPAGQPGTRPRGGAGILLSPQAVRAWRHTGRWRRNYGDGIIAIRLKLEAGGRRRRRWLRLFIISSYAPACPATKKVEATAHLRALEDCLRDARAKEIIVLGTDLNVHLGTAEDRGAGLGTVGPYGVPATDRRNIGPAMRVHRLLGSYGLASAATFFQQTRHRYYTYTSVSSASVTRHQLDHIIVRKRHIRHLVINAFATDKQATQSDHKRVRATLDIKLRSRRKRRQRRPDASLLAQREDEDNPDNVHRRFLRELKAVLASTQREIDSNVLTRYYSAMTSALQRALPEKAAIRQEWYTTDQATKLAQLIEARAAASREKKKATRRRLPVHDANKAFWTATKKVRVYVRSMKAKWLWTRCRKLNAGGENDLTKTHTKEAWNIIREISTGHPRRRRVKAMNLMDPDTGIPATTVKRNADLFAAHLQQKFGEDTPFDPEAVARLKQRRIDPTLAELPTEEEIVQATMAMRTHSAPGPAGVPVVAIKLAMSDDSTRELLVKALQEFWRSDQLIFEEWKTAKLIPIPKGGDTHLPKNWRTIALQDVLAKVLAKVLAQRIQGWAHTNISESQNGFRRYRGTTEAIFCVTQTVRSRRRHGLQTWAVFADLKAAFDTVSRRGLAAIMQKYGFPNKIINIVNRLHDNAYFEYKLDSERRTVKNNAGVRQGDTAAPILFILAMNAAMELCKWPSGGTPVSIAYQGWRNGNDTSDPRRPKRIAHIEYADDVVLLFTNRRAAEQGTSTFLKAVHAVAGMSGHFASTHTAPSKTVAICFPCKGTTLEHAAYDTSPLRITGPDGNPGYVPVVEQVKHLGMPIHWRANFAAAVQQRAAKARQATTALRRVLQAQHLQPRVKGNVLRATILPILLYSSENWAVNSNITKRLSVAWNRACKLAVREQSATKARRRLRLQDIQFYLRQRTMAWLGKMLRMKLQRWPRHLLASTPRQQASDRKIPRTRAAPAPCKSRVRLRAEIRAAKRALANRNCVPAEAERLVAPQFVAAQRGAECIVTGRTIPETQVCLTVRRQNRTRAAISIAGAITQMMRHGEQWLDNTGNDNLPGVQLLSPTHREDAELLRSHQVRRAVRIVGLSNELPIPLPTSTPWQCTRCGKIYKQHVHHAQTHALRADCRRKRAKPVVPPGPPTTFPTWRGSDNKRWTSSAADMIVEHLNDLDQTGRLPGLTKILRKNPYCMDCQGPNTRPCDLCVISHTGMIANNHPALWEFLATNSNQKKPPPVPSHDELSTYRDAAEIHWIDQQRVQFCFLVEECYNSFNTYTDLLSPHNRMVRSLASWWLAHHLPAWFVAWVEWRSPHARHGAEFLVEALLPYCHLDRGSHNPFSLHHPAPVSVYTTATLLEAFLIAQQRAPPRARRRKRQWIAITLLKEIRSHGGLGHLPLPSARLSQRAFQARVSPDRPHSWEIPALTRLGILALVAALLCLLLLPWPQTGLQRAYLRAVRR